MRAGHIEYFRRHPALSARTGTCTVRQDFHGWRPPFPEIRADSRWRYNKAEGQDDAPKRQSGMRLVTADRRDIKRERHTAR